MGILGLAPEIRIRSGRVHYASDFLPTGRAWELAMDPVHLAQCYFQNFGAFSTAYLRNRYRGL